MAIARQDKAQGGHGAINPLLTGAAANVAAVPDTPETDETATIEAVLRGGLRWLRFPPSLEAGFQAQNIDRARRYSDICILIGLAVFDMFVLTDYAVIPDIWRFAAITRLLVVTPAALVCTAVAYWLIPERYLRQAIQVNLTFYYLVVAGCLILFQIMTRSPHAAFYLGGMPLVVTFFALLGATDFWVMAASSVVVLVMNVVGLHFAPVVETAVKFQLSVILLGIVVLVDLFGYVAERSLRVTYLMARLQVLSNLRERALSESLDRANAELRMLAQTDALTGVANRRGFDTRLSDLWGACAAHGRTISLVLLDIDYFKAYNDNYGHPAGDAALRAVAQIIGSEFRGRQDLVARYGGEEFAVALPDCDLLDAEKVARRLCTAVAEAGIPHDARPDGLSCVTISLGAASVCPTKGADPGNLVSAADTALYRAKAQGRNCVMIQSSAGGNRITA